MARLRFFVYDLSGKCYQINHILSYELSKSINAACDGLRLTYVSDNAIGEIKTVEVFDDEKKIFKGFCDTQQETVNGSGGVSFIYARSSICLLVDNQAQPCIYQSPSLNSLFIKNAGQFGFVNKLPDIYCNAKYQVSPGSSCYSALNDFANAVTGRRIMADAFDNLYLPKYNETVNLNDYSIISEKRNINRGQVLTEIDYKINSSDDYIYHCKSSLAESRDISRSKKINLASLPEWQRKFTLSNMLQSGSNSYYSVELLFDGSGDFSLYDNVVFEGEYLGVLDGYYIASVCSLCDGKGERTKLILYKNIDVKEINYVD